MANQQIIPIFYACDDAFVKYTVVSLHSMIKNASHEFCYHVHILHTQVSKEMKDAVTALENENFHICFDDVTPYLDSIGDTLPVRDYYSKTTYFRLFIAEMFPQYRKVIYIDSDTVVAGDISALYLTDIGDSWLGACHEQAMVQVNEYGTYAERVVGVSRHNFFNAGLMLINCEQFRLHKVHERFLKLLGEYHFAVTQDEDYLNLICKDHVYWLDQRWNTEIFGEIAYPIAEAHVLHYIMVSKPWHYEDCRHGEIFWQYARETSVYDMMHKALAAYTDEERARDLASMNELKALAVRETNREDNYLNRINQARSEDRIAVLKKIEAYEREGKFDVDVEEDPPSRELLPDEVDYYHRGILAGLKSKLAFRAAHKFVDGLIKDQKMILKEIRGIEHLQNLNSGAVITCNHFNAFDSFAMQLAYEAAKQPRRKFYRVIREGNYTSFPGFYGFLMRNCHTLPLSSNRRTLQNFTKAMSDHLQDGHFVLVYPEQSMWWNYRKPKPLKSGAYLFAAKNNVPVVPCFITMQDSDIMGEDGFYVQEYTVHIAAPIYPDPALSYRQNIPHMMQQNADVWREIYETTYCMPLEYSTAVQ